MLLKAPFEGAFFRCETYPNIDIFECVIVNYIKRLIFTAG